MTRYPVFFAFSRAGGNVSPGFEQCPLKGEELRKAMLNTFLVNLHRSLEVLQKLHNSILSCDPLFYGHLACWYILHGEVREHKDIFLAHLLSGALPEHREASFVLLQQLPPQEVSRVVDYCKRVQKKFPRSARTAVIHFLKALEDDRKRFELATLESRRYLKHLYASLHVKPSERVQAILFSGDPPPGSALYALKRLSLEDEDEVIERLINENGLPLPICFKTIKFLTSSLVLRLLEKAPHDQIRCSLPLLLQRGFLKSDEVRALLEEKVGPFPIIPRRSVHGHKRMMMSTFEEPPDHEGEISALISEMALKEERIRKPVALLVDKSGSIDGALTAGKMTAALMAALGSARCSVYLFDARAFKIESGSASYEGWNRIFSEFSPGGPTSIGSALEALISEGVPYEHLIIVTDGNENADPSFFSIYKHYHEVFSLSPPVSLVKVGHFSPDFERRMMKSDITYTALEFRGTYRSLSRLVPPLLGPSLDELKREIMNIPLPARERALT
ncbi:MAG: hypothetical protein RDV48_16365 [Candidatus Eremiobacteraeota bacterium]|nr:hypothetical protein [Candidatus Eremiobacteraeota bacterium]